MARLAPARDAYHDDTANCASMNAVTKRGIAAVRSDVRAHQVDGGKFGLMLPGEIGLDPGLQRFA